jgi:hypothetical protein
MPPSLNGETFSIHSFTEKKTFLCPLVKMNIGKNGSAEKEANAAGYLTFGRLWLLV